MFGKPKDRPLRRDQKPPEPPPSFFPYNHFARGDDPYERDIRPCQTCGATVPSSYWVRHVEWHEANGDKLVTWTDETTE